MVKVLGLDHVSVLVEDAEKSLSFYRNILSLPLLERPKLGFPGYWLDLGGGQSLHLMQLPNPRAVSEDRLPEHGGRDMHFALRVESVNAVIEKLASEEIFCTKSRSGRSAIFLRDPDGNAIELYELQ